jgi:hypothetical protein
MDAPWTQIQVVAKREHQLTRMLTPCKKQGENNGLESEVRYFVVAAGDG